MRRFSESDGVEGSPAPSGHGWKHLIWAFAGTGVGLLAALWVGGQLEPVTSKLDGVVQGIQDASSTVQDKISDVRTSARKNSLALQVDSRLKQDKAIDSARIEVSCEEDGTIVLRGSVPDDSDKDKAATLARDTRGVAKVIDHLAIPPAPRVIAAGPAEVEQSPRVK